MKISERYCKFMKKKVKVEVTENTAEVINCLSKDKECKLNYTNCQFVAFGGENPFE